ncbi:tetratricopeptide repeat protein [uncultured Shewanella sp.]|uniref:tetratricopeptide repeat protein n=1 Tax=Shewanella atlantica TaxID=271099 RepID=UPI00261923B9|nr:tetratricopeptide repeat protein [uncultured Shewanella sp.]
MIDDKWLGLLNFMQQETHSFKCDKPILDSLNDRVGLLKNQFGNVSNINNPQFIDWIEHEAFSAVLNDIFKDELFNKDELDKLFNALFKAKLFQLALSLISNNKPIFSAGDFDIKSGMVFHQLGELDQAEKAFTQAITHSPANYLGHFHLGYLHLARGDNEQAINYFTECTRLAPEFAGGFQNLAGCQYQAGEFESSIKSCTRVYEISPTLIACYITAISSCLALKRPVEANSWLERAEVNEVYNPELSRLRGIWAHQTQQYSDAVKALSEYLKVRPDDIDVLAIRAQALAAAKQWEPLLPELKILLELDPHDVWALEQLFLANYHTEQWQQAGVAMSALSKMSTQFKQKYLSQMDEIRKNLAIAMMDVE